MSLDQAFRLSSILLAASAFTGFTLVAGLSAWFLLLGGAALTASLLHLLGMSWIDRLLPFRRLSSDAWNVFLLLAFLGFWVDFFLISLDLLPAGAHFLIVLMVNKLFNLKQRRDFLHLYAISLITVLTSAALTTDFWYAAIFLAYLLAAVWTLLLYHLTQEAKILLPVRPPIHPFLPTSYGAERITARFFWTTNGMAAGAFCITLAIFFSLPRIGAGLFQRSGGGNLRTSGFSERVDLGVIGTIKLDPSIVMRVETPDRLSSERLYLRGMAFDRYDGRSWSNSFSHRRVLGESAPGTFQVSGGVVPRRNQREEASFRQDILLEALDTAVLFGAPFPDFVSGEFMAVQADAMGATYLPYPSSTRVRYTVYSRPTHLFAEERSAPSLTYPEFIRKHFLQLPHSASPRVAELARQITQHASTPQETVAVIKQHLFKEYQYSLDVGPTSSARPLEEFLFSRKTGYCEHYATAMVVLLRTVGIPARLVTGFLATEWNEFGNYYTVRQRDAHAWVEVFFPYSGWITVDPTPAGAEPLPGTGLESMGRMLDSLRLRWDRLILQFSGEDQLAVVQTIREGSDGFRANVQETMTAFSSLLSNSFLRAFTHLKQTNNSQIGLMLGIVVFGCVILVLFVRAFPRVRSHQTGPQSPQQFVVIQLYRGLLELVESRGIVRRPSTTSAELVELVKRRWPEANNDFQILTQLYCRARFGHYPLTTNDMAVADHLLETLRTLPRTATRG